MTHYTIHDLPCDDRPREKLLTHGADSLSNSEALAIIIGSGMRGKTVVQLAQELIASFGSMDALADATVDELKRVKGMGTAKAVQVKAAFSLAKRVQRSGGGEKPRIDTPKRAYELLRDELEGEKRECVIGLLLDVRNAVIGKEQISVGTLSESLVHPREVFYPAIRHGAAGMILAHNHPSGDPSPSPEDFQVTKTLIDAGKLLGIPLHDHIIVGKGRYISLRERGVQF